MALSSITIQRRYRLLTALAVTVLLSVQIPLDAGFPLDDSWIFVVFASNLQQHGQWSFNPGEPSAGVSSLLWTWLLSWLPVSQAPPAPDLARAVRIMMSLLGGGLLALPLFNLFYSGLEGSSRHRSRLAGLITLLTLTHGAWMFQLYSGMESGLFVSLGCLTIALAASGHPLFAGLSAMALVLTRLEGMLLVGVVGLFLLANHQRLWKQRLSALVALLVPAGLAVLATFAHNWRIGGELLPSTFAGRRFLFKLDPDQLHLNQIGPHLRKFVLNWIEKWHDWYWMEDFLPGQSSAISAGGFQLHPLAVVLGSLALLGGLVRLVRCCQSRRWHRNAPLWLLLLWTILHNLFYVVVLPAPGHAGRYQAMNYLWPIFLVVVSGQELVRLGASFVGRGGTGFSHRGAWKITGYLAAWVMVVVVIVSGIVWNEVLRSGIERINSLHIAMGRWAAEHLDNDARVVVFDLGGFKAASGLYIVDQSGLLNDRGLESFRQHNSPVFYRQERATHLFRFEELDASDATLPAVWQTDLVLEHRLALREEHGLDRQACHNTWSRCSLYRIDFQKSPDSAISSESVPE